MTTNGGELSTVVEQGQEHQIDANTLLKVISGGDLAALNDKEKLAVYRARCEAAGLDYRAQPFQIIKLQGKEVLYCLKAGADQLAAKHGVRCEIVSQVTESGIRTVTVRSYAKDGRQTDEVGCVNVASLTGDALCNAYMKAITKAKRRAILSICGLGMLDETELETIPGSSAPPALPLPPRRSEKARKVAEAAPAVIEGNGGHVEAPAEQMPLVVPDDGPNPLDDADVIRVRVATVSTKKGGEGKKAWTLYGVKYIDFENDSEPAWANTFDTVHGKRAEKARDNGLVARIRVAPSPKFEGKFGLIDINLEEPTEA